MKGKETIIITFNIQGRVLMALHVYIKQFLKKPMYLKLALSCQFHK